MIQFMKGFGCGYGGFKMSRSTSGRKVQSDDEIMIQFMVGLGDGFGAFKMGTSRFGRKT